MTDINRLTCEEIFRRLDDYLDRELTAEEMARVRGHLETCEVCAREYDFEEKVLVNLRERLRGSLRRVTCFRRSRRASKR
jgi:anti-sigma factor (TIGR02949 family)